MITVLARFKFKASLRLAWYSQCANYRHVVGNAKDTIML